MVAQYKYKRLKEEQSYDGPPKHLKLEGSERQRGKKEAKQGLDEAEQAEEIEKELEWDEEVSKASWCYAQQKADPNYVCRCFEEETEE